MDGLLELENGIAARKREEGRRELQERLQAEVDALGAVGADGQPLKRVQRIGMVVDTTMGEVRLLVPSGIVMMDGWMVRCRGARWGEEDRPPEERVEWKECK